jgi:hypothetical protein
MKLSRKLALGSVFEVGGNPVICCDSCGLAMRLKNRNRFTAEELIVAVLDHDCPGR